VAVSIPTNKMITKSDIENMSIDTLDIGFIVTDENQRVVIINKAALGLLKLTGAIKSLTQALGHLPPELDLLEHIKFCSPENKSCDFHEIKLGERQLRVFLSPIFDGDDLRGNVITLEDISDAKEKEHSRDAFFSLVVHELRTPLTAIRGNTSLIQEYFPEALKDDKLKQIVGDINTGSVYLIEMVNQFLDMSRLEEGRIVFDLKQFDAAETLKTTTDGLGVLAKEKGLTLEFVPVEGISTQVIADPTRTKQVLTNLIGNGLKFTEKGKISITYRVNGDELTVLVQDSGQGIPKDSQHKLFQKYFQASNNTIAKDSSKSTGLGLYMTRLVVEGMEGKIFLASSKENEGSVFAFSLPMATPENLKKLQKKQNDAKNGVHHTQLAK
jgi:NtrC-family two-component system sensor histidine kinase KinB